MTAIKLIYFDGCPNAGRARDLLNEIGVAYDEIRQDDLSATDRLRSYTSPTILNNGEVIAGSETEGAGGGCSVNLPSANELRQRLGLHGGRPRPGGAALSFVGSIFSAVTVGFCPICIPAFGAFLSAIGLGFLVREEVLKPLLLIFLGIALSGMLWSYFKEHRRISPFIFGVVFSVGLYLGRYVYWGATVNGLLEWGSIAGLISVSLWNIRLKKTVTCSACNPGGHQCAS
jgi:hypothetical protein